MKFIERFKVKSLLEGTLLSPRWYGIPRFHRHQFGCGPKFLWFRQWLAKIQSDQISNVKVMNFSVIFTVPRYFCIYLKSKQHKKAKLKGQQKLASRTILLLINILLFINIIIMVASDYIMYNNYYGLLAFADWIRPRYKLKILTFFINWF